MPCSGARDRLSDGSEGGPADLRNDSLERAREIAAAAGREG